MSKRILFDVGHPAQVHQFKHLYWELQKKGWEGLFTVKDKEIAVELLNIYNLPYEIIGKNEKGLRRKFTHLPNQISRFNKVVKSFKPDFILSRFSLHSALVGKFRNVVQLGFADTEHTKLLDSVTVPFVDVKITAYSYQKELGKNHIRFDGNIELFYLHPQFFKPDISIYDLLGINANEKFVILRFVSWNAHHDIGQQGFSYEHKLDLVKKVNKYARVFITSEEKLPAELKPYQIKIPPEKMHDALAYAELYVGEGGTMASESAVLGTPSIYVNTLTGGVVEELEEDGLLFGYRNSDGVIEKALELLETPNLKSDWTKRKNEMLLEKINVTAFMVWFIENYPESLTTMNENVNFDKRFI